MLNSVCQINCDTDTAINYISFGLFEHELSASDVSNRICYYHIKGEDEKQLKFQADIYPYLE